MVSRALKFRGSVREILPSAIFTWLKIARPCEPLGTAHSTAASKNFASLLFGKSLLSVAAYGNKDYPRLQETLYALKIVLRVPR